MHIALVRQFYYPKDHHVQRDAEALVHAGHIVEIISLREKGESKLEVINGVLVHRLPLSHKRSGFTRYIFEYVIFFVMVFFTLSRIQFNKQIECSGNRHDA